MIVDGSSRVGTTSDGCRNGIRPIGVKSVAATISEPEGGLVVFINTRKHKDRLAVSEGVAGIIARLSRLPERHGILSTAVGEIVS